MAVAADVGLRFVFVVSFDVEEFEAVFSALGEDVIVSAFLGGRIGNAEEELGHVVAFFFSKESDFSFVVLPGVTIEEHSAGEASVDEVTRGAFWVVGVGVGRSMTVNFGAVISTVGIAGNAIPVEGCGVAKTPDGHGGARLDLVAAADDGSFENPEKLVGVAIGMATGTGEGCRGGGEGGVEGDAAAFKNRRGGIVEGDGGF